MEPSDSRRKNGLIMPPPISIIIPAFNEVAFCRRCIASIFAHTQDRPYRLILVDNGSTDGVGEYFDSVPGATVIHAEKNLGFAGGVNLGLAHAEGHVLLLNNDTLVPMGWLGRLANALESAENIGMVGPRSNCVSGDQQIDGLSFASMDEINAFADEWAVRNAGRLRDVSRLVGFCLLIRREAFETVGLFDESFGIGNYEDDDYGCRVMDAGYRLCIAEEAFVFHFGSRTFHGMGMTDEEWRALMESNRRFFVSKRRKAGDDRPEASRASLSLNRQAAQAVIEGDDLAALRHLKSAIERDPRMAVNYRDLAALLRKMGMHEKASEYLELAARMETGDTTTPGGTLSRGDCDSRIP